MAIPALCYSILGGKLAGVRIRVAGFTILWRSLELNLMGVGERLVAFDASDRAMCPRQGKFRFRMVKAADVDPGPGAVAGFAAHGRSVGALLLHALLEFAFVWIRVAGGACGVLEMEGQNLVCSTAEARFVAVHAGNGHVSTGQRKACVLVLGDRERRAMKVLYGMAILATILVGSGGKLLVMRILMAVHASSELYFVDSVLAGRRVALVASDCRMFSFEWIVRCRVLFHAKL